MKVFKDELEFRRIKNRHSRYFGFKGLLLKLTAFIIFLIVIKGFSERNIENLFSFFSSKQNTSEINLGE